MVLVLMLCCGAPQTCVRMALSDCPPVRTALCVEWGRTAPRGSMRCASPATLPTPPPPPRAPLGYTTVQEVKSTNTAASKLIHVEEKLIEEHELLAFPHSEG